MQSSADFEIDVSQEFPHLTKAPIVEAVIEFRGLNSSKWKPREMSAAISELVTGYRIAEQGVKQTIKVSQDVVDESTAIETHQRTEVVGYRFKHRDQSYLAQFERQLFLLSRLAPYNSWTDFVAEAFRLWGIHQRIIHFESLQRLGLRYVNAIEVPYDGLLSDYLVNMPQLPNDLPIPHVGFFYRDVLTVPNTEYRITINRSIQPREDSDSFFNLVLDTDVVYEERAGVAESVVQRHLSEMRWLKNKVFFGSLTQKCIEGLE